MSASPAQAEKAETFYALHHRGQPFVIPNPWDAGSAKILTAKGFEALATTSVGVDHMSGHRSGTAGLDEVIANAGLIAQSSPLPVSVDLEDCYANTPEGIAETIRRAADAGAVGGSIEDVKFGTDGEPYSLNEAVDRVKAAVAAAKALPFKFTLTARCENFLFGRTDMQDTLVRLKAFEEAGADVLYAPGLMQPEQVEQVINTVNTPLNVLLGLGSTSMAMADMHRLGVARISLGSALHRAATTAMLNAIEEIQLSGTFGFTKELAAMSAIDDLLDETSTSGKNVT